MSRLNVSANDDTAAGSPKAKHRDGCTDSRPYGDDGWLTSSPWEGLYFAEYPPETSAERTELFNL